MSWVKLLLAALLSIFIIQCAYLPSTKSGARSVEKPSAKAARVNTDISAVDEAKKSGAGVDGPTTNHVKSHTATPDISALKDSSSDANGVAKKRARGKVADTSSYDVASHKKLRHTSLPAQPSVKKIAERDSDDLGKVVFLRSSFVASAINATIYEVIEGSPDFVAEVKNNTQVHYRLDAGYHTFMLVSENSIDYLKVNVAPSLSYYAIVKPSMGAWKPSFSFTPIKAHGGEQTKDSQKLAFLKDEKVQLLFSGVTQIVQVDELRSSHLGLQGRDLMVRHQEHWDKWKREATKVHESKTLNAIDGV